MDAQFKYFRRYFLAMLALVFANNSCDALAQEELSRYQAIEAHMGVRFQIILYAPSDEVAERAFQLAFGEIERLDNLLSDYKPESELSMLGMGSPHHEAVAIDPSFAEVLRAAVSISELSDGAFDPTVGPLTRLWRKSQRVKTLPDEATLSEALNATGYQAVQIDADESAVRLKLDGMRLDLGGIAKGYAADRALSELREIGIKHALINASGDITLGEAPPGTEGWNVGVAPLDATREPSIILKLANCGVATSGDAWQAIEIDGKRYSHIVDPKTGLGLVQRSSVTVIAPDGTSADAWASAVSVLGPKMGVARVDELENLEALVVYLDEESEVQVVKTRTFPKPLE